MRLWSLHPRYLDAKGLVALWREALLAKAVLAGKTKGYRHHPQLERFRAAADPAAAIGGYLAAVLDEARSRGYRFDGRKVGRGGTAKAGAPRLLVTEGQLAYEMRHLLGKLAERDPDRRAALEAELVQGAPIEPHPLFRLVPGGVEDWERRRDL